MMNWHVLLRANQTFTFLWDHLNILILNCPKTILALEYPSSALIFNKAIQSEQKLYEIIFFVMMKLTPVCVYVPWCIYTYFIYFYGDAQSNVFELPFPMW